MDVEPTPVGHSGMERRSRERQGFLAREGGPVHLLAEVARTVSVPEEMAERAIAAVLHVLERRLGLSQAAIEWIPEGRPRPEAPALAGSTVRVPIVRRGEAVAVLSCELGPTDPAAADELLIALSLVAHLIAQTAGECRDALAAAARQGAAPRPAALLGSSPAVLAVFRNVMQVATSELNVLILGESGTGKESVARAIHEQGPRARAPFVVLNDATAKEALAACAGPLREASLAQPATLFVDEIGELASDAEAELLDLLCHAELERGAGRLGVRVIAATRLDLAAALRACRFRKDLYYRVQEFLLELPPLRTRRSDVSGLAHHFMAKHAALQGKAVARISEPALELLCAYDWPGNVRELENCMARAVVLAHYGVVRQHHLPRALQPQVAETAAQSLRAESARFERELIAEALQIAGGNRAAAAQRLGITPRVLAYRIKRLGQ